MIITKTLFPCTISHLLMSHFFLLFGSATVNFSILGLFLKKGEESYLPSFVGSYVMSFRRNKNNNKKTFIKKIRGYQSTKAGRSLHQHNNGIRRQELLYTVHNQRIKSARIPSGK
jgi:hypothetical protein